MRHEPSLSTDANLARLGQALKDGNQIDDPISWAAGLLVRIELDDDRRRRSQAQRLFDDLANLMTEAEIATAQQQFETALIRRSQSKVVSIEEAARRRMKSESS